VGKTRWTGRYFTGIPPAFRGPIAGGVQGLFKEVDTMSSTENRGLDGMYFENQKPVPMPSVSSEAIMDSAERFLQREKKLCGGLVYFDQEVKKSLTLIPNPDPKEDPARVREGDKVFKLGDGAYLACLSMRSQYGEDYAVDFFEEGHFLEELSVTSIRIRRVNGPPCDAWITEGELTRQSLPD
jgi:hypothetical protein